MYQKQQINTPSKTFYLKTPEKQISTLASSPFRVISFSEKQQQFTPNQRGNMSNYPPVQPSLNQIIQPTHYLNQRDISSFKLENQQLLLERLNNTNDHMKTINNISEYKINELNKKNEELIKYIEQQNKTNEKLDEKCKKYKQKAQQFEYLYLEKQKEKSDNSLYNDKLKEIQQNNDQFQILIRQKQNEINELKNQLKEQQQDTNQLLNQCKENYEDLCQQNESLLQENNHLKLSLLQINQFSRTISSKKQSEQDFQTNTDFIDEQQLNQVLEQYLLSDNNDSLNLIPLKQMPIAMEIMKGIVNNINIQQQKQIKEVKSQKFCIPNPQTEVLMDLNELLQRKQLLLKKFHEKQEMNNNNKVNKNEKNKLQTEIDQLIIEINNVDKLIQLQEKQNEQSLHRNSCVSFENQEFS